MHAIIFESNSRAGKTFDIILLVMILLSVFVVMLDSISEYHEKSGDLFYVMEWCFTILFTIEYILRVLCVKYPVRYVFGFLGIIDFLSILPMYLSLVLVGTQSLLVLRILRLLRVFRIFKLTHYVAEMSFLGEAMKSSAKKIAIFMLVVLSMVIILGSVMFLAEGSQNGFHSIPDSIYWAIVTITTVGYGDITPVTNLGKFVASFIMMLGYGIIAVPTGIVTTEMALRMRGKKMNHQNCPGCGREGHDENARFCKYCGEKL